MSEVLGVALSRQLQEKLYDKRKTAALEIERLVREALVVNNTTKVDRIIQAIVGDFAYSTLPNARNGGLIALAAVAIALGVDELALRLDVLVPPILSCFSDPDTRVRYYACESMYNVGKVARRHILRFFNEILDALSRLVADTDPSVKNGAELLDRLVKDIVCEYASYYSQQHLDQQQQLPSSQNSRPPSEPAFPAAPGSLSLLPEMLPTTFNFPRFIPLLSERIKTLNPFTRMYLIQWITTLDSIPYLELVAYLPEFLDGLFNYLSDPNLDVRTAALNLLGEFLKEIHDVVQVQKEQGVLNVIGKRSISSTPSFSGIVDLNTRNRANSSSSSNSSISSASKHTPPPFQPPSYQNGANVVLDIGKIVFILTPHVSSSDEETQATALRWIHQLLALVQRVMIPFTPELVASILPCLAHHVTPIRNIAVEANAALFKLVAEFGVVLGYGSAGVLYLGSEGGGAGAGAGGSPGVDVGGGFEVKSAVDALTKQFQDESEETRVASMEWLAMLHKKAPKKVIDSDDVTFQALLRLLSDTSEEVVKKDLQLLAQISMTSDDDYFTRFLLNLLDLFASNKRLLESRGSLIIRHLCLSLNPERMFRVFAEILEREEDLEFASLMIQTLNIILVTAPELSDLRRRLKNLDSRDGLLLFAVLYRSWCHNPVSTFCLCLLSQAYEHASTLLQTFADLEITVQFLIQVDKLVQLIESPVFTYLRLQLLEPERYPFLYKTLYGILMLLPQSSAFATLRNRLNSVGNMVMLYGLAPGAVGAGVGSGIGGAAPLPGSAKKLKPQSEPLGLKWSELLVHFRNVQNRHERSRRTGKSIDSH
ncbi:vacuolar protein 14 C-terminal Fig4p binding-domain-containing protein [Chytriomyces cf. hyalinus JEL632]|nr:vacuolar protein 14 C-terminal Fig4p binding-domain-containing protein [Chytriomyces cf. hyalinus JEL632]